MKPTHKNTIIVTLEKNQIFILEVGPRPFCQSMKLDIGKYFPEGGWIKIVRRKKEKLK